MCSCTSINDRLCAVADGRTSLRRLAMPRMHAGLQDGSGQLTLRRLQEFAGRHGGVALGQEQLASIFRDFKPADETHVSLGAQDAPRTAHARQLMLPDSNEAADVFVDYTLQAT